jgi:hypothetical protein
MATDYRPVLPDEVDAAILLAATALGFSAEQRQSLTTLCRSDPRHGDRMFVAVAPGGALLSMAHYCLRDIRGADGAPRRVGLLGVMATREEARRQGHAGRLLDLTIAAMEGDGCAWSLLDASELGRSLYERHGWRGFPCRWSQGTVVKARTTAPARYAIRRYDPRTEPTAWAPLAAVYAAYNAARPLSVVRDRAYWQGFAAHRYIDGLSRNRGVVLVAARPANPADIRGYVLAYVQEAGFTRQFGLPFGTFTVLEIGATPGDEAALPALLFAVVDEAARHGVDKGRVHLPDDPTLTAAVAEIFGASLRSGHDWEAMGRPIAAGVTDADVAATFAAPGAFHWLIDTF